MRIDTCTPVAFHANENFFSRDSGLICRQLRCMGVESKSIMPLPSYEDDYPQDVLRVDYACLESADWWRSQQLDGLVLYSWASPHYVKIAQAVHEAGIRFLLHFDAAGLELDIKKATLPPLQRLWARLKNIPVNYLRAKSMKLADALSCSAVVREKLRRHPFFGESVARRCVEMPCPVLPEFCYNGQAKEDLIVLVGRWDDEYYKRPAYMMRLLDCLYQGGEEARTEIYGQGSPALEAWHAALPEGLRSKIRLMGRWPHGEMPAVYQRARVSVCTSISEGSHTASAEALCCGCSLVAPFRSPFLDNVIGYTKRDSGRVAAGDTPELLAAALAAELLAWRRGRRDAAAIAAAWQPSFHVRHVLQKVFNITPN